MQAEPSYDTPLPLWMTRTICCPPNTPISARRFLSLARPERSSSPGEDDHFSRDLSDDQLRQTFGMIKSRGLLRNKLMVLFSGADQVVPDWVDE